MHVRYSYLPQQFSQIDDLMAQLREFVVTGDFTLGKPLVEFERRFADLIGVRHAIGVGSGTDAIKLPLKALGVGHGDEVITAANTFIATVGAIAELGAVPVFVDCDDTFCMDVSQVEAKITPRTKAIVPVHFTGYMTQMEPLMEIAFRRGLPVVEDACQAILADIGGKRAGTWAEAGSFSLHPLKNLNVWGDGGVVTTNDHGMRNRDEIEVLGYNSRLDALQAVVGNWLIGSTHQITDQRIANAEYFDRALGQIKQIRIPPRVSGMKKVYHIYIVFAEDRDGLYKHCQSRGIECKIHYPVPLYLQDGLKIYGHKAGDFPVTDRHTREIISFPCDQHLSRDEQDYVIATVAEYYG